ncbi:MAG: ribonuclease HII, partial [Anaerolineales bacterium]|nr:ribonuclease HII [Anaerolineales bacterium]
MVDGPTLEFEAPLHEAGLQHIAGLDEAGRGALAGPVTAAAVILPLGNSGALERLSGVRDSKLLSPAQRERALEVIF